MNISLSVSNRLHRIAVSIFFFIAGLTGASWASRIPDIKTTLQLSEAALGGVLFAVPVGQLISLPLSGWLISRFGSRQLLIYASIFFPLTLIMLAFAATTWQLVLQFFPCCIIVNNTACKFGNCMSRRSIPFHGRCKSRIYIGFTFGYQA